MQPEAAGGALTAREDEDACASLIRAGSRTFHLASLALPAEVRSAALALYAFCRLADDEIDHAPSALRAAQALDGLKARLVRAYAADPLPLAADRAFARVVRDYAIPIEVPAALLEGFEWDAAGRRYDDFQGVLDYSTRVAGTVGVMMALVMGARAPAALARACELGIAMQLSNIARDVGEDARRGRLYLPLDWIRSAGLDPERLLADPRPSPALASIIARLLDEAEAIYASASRGVGYLPAQCRLAINMALYLYRDIGHQVRRNGLDAVTRRAVLPATRKAADVGAAVVGLVRLRRTSVAPPPAAGAFLVEAVLRTVPPQPVGAHHRARSAVPAAAGSVPSVAWWNLQARIAQTLELFIRLEQRSLT
jgi:phytoene synthase